MGHMGIGNAEGRRDLKGETNVLLRTAAGDRSFILPKPTQFEIHTAIHCRWNLCKVTEMLKMDRPIKYIPVVGTAYANNL